MKKKNLKSNNLKAKQKMTPREVEVFELILNGFDNRGIAEEMGISYSTAKVHSCRILKKLNVNSKNQVMAKYL